MVRCSLPFPESELMPSAPFLSAFVIAIMMLSLWVASLARRDASIIDIAWGIGFVLIAWAVYAQQVFIHRMPGMWLPLMVTLWGLRLSGYLFLRNRGRPEDYRYVQMREKWGQSFWWISLFTVFLLQGVVMWLVSLPVQVGIQSSATEQLTGKSSLIASTMFLLGIGLWVIGLTIETVADWQLSRFKSDPSNRHRVMDSGLWRYSRHPNYFGECLVWWGIFLVAQSSSSVVWLVASPILMTILLLRVSGVALLESNLRVTKPEYEAYMQRTSAFIPWFPQ